MIVRNLTLKVQGNRTCTDSPIYLYQNDRNIHLVITLNNVKYEVTRDMYVSFTIVKPNGDVLDLTNGFLKDGKVHLILESELFDGDEEVGNALCQIKLYDNQRLSSISLPPFAIHVLKDNGNPIIDNDKDALLSQDELKLLTENELALSVECKIKISDLPTTTEVAGYVPVTQGDTTYKLDMSQVATKDDVANVTIDLSPYATKEEVNTKADKEHNHDTVYAPKEHEHSQYLEEQDLSEYATKNYVATEIANAQLSGGEGEIDLSGYATHDEVTKAVANKADKEHNHDTVYALKSELVHNHDNNYAPKTHNHSYNNLTDLPTIPSVDGLASEDYVDNAVANVKVDTSNLATKEELQNHKHDTLYAPINHEHDNYLTEHQSISHLATKADMLNKADKEHAHSYNDLEDKPTIPSVDGLATETYVDDAIANIPLTDYALKTDLPTHTNELINNSGFITEVPSEYVTDEELNAKGYLTQHQSLDHLALKTDIPTVPTNISAFTNDAGYITEVPSEYVTETELQAKGYLTSHQDISHLATKEEIPNVDGMVTSQTVVRIELVDELPTTQEYGVLYIVKASE